MDTYEKIYNPELREEIQHLRKRYSIPTCVMRELAKRGTRSVRYNSEPDVSDYIDNLDDTFGVNVTDGVLYTNSLMGLSHLPEKIQAEDTVGRFQKTQRMSLEDYFKSNEGAFKKDLTKPLAASGLPPESEYSEGVLFALARKITPYLDYHVPE